MLTFQLIVSLAKGGLADRQHVVPAKVSNTVERKPLRTGRCSTSMQESRAAHEVNELLPQLTPKKLIH